jgi:hypothetical protein
MILFDSRFLVQGVTELAMQTDKALVLVAHALEALRHRQVILPALTLKLVPGYRIRRPGRKPIRRTRL